MFLYYPLWCRSAASCIAILGEKKYRTLCCGLVYVVYVHDGRVVANLHNFLAVHQNLPVVRLLSFRTTTTPTKTEFNLLVHG